MAVHAGGVLDQHTPDLVDHERHSPGADEYGEIEVSTTTGSGSPRWSGDRLAVNCHHHQSVQTHPGFVAAAHAADGTLEAMEAPGDRFCVAVQWHPETAADVGLLVGLLRAAAEYAAARSLTPAARRRCSSAPTAAARAPPRPSRTRSRHSTTRWTSARTSSSSTCSGAATARWWSPTPDCCGVRRRADPDRPT